MDGVKAPGAAEDPEATEDEALFLVTFACTAPDAATIREVLGDRLSVGIAAIARIERIVDEEDVPC